MDILISSNLERLIYTLGGAEMTADLMAQLKENGKYTAPDELMEKIRSRFSGFFMTEEETADEIKQTWENENYLIDPHTAVGLGCVRKYRRATGDETKTVLASTASPYKFAPAVCEALGIEHSEEGDIFALLDKLSEKTNTPIPAPLADAAKLNIRFTEVIPKEDMAELIFRV